MLNRVAIFIFLLFISQYANSQITTHTNTEQQLENLTDADQSETEDDSFLQVLEHLRKNPLNLNKADENDLKELKILTGLQIADLIRYRNLFGNFISVYELQAIPSWDLNTIRKLLPFIAVSEAEFSKELLAERLKNGEHSLLTRLSQVLERSRGFDPSGSGTKYTGSRQRIFFRYRYQSKNLLQYGLVGDKDAGEQFLKGSQNKGFDFYSFHFFARRIGSIQSLAIGDFTVNMGQGLIQWQSLAFRKSVDVLGTKRQSPVLRPYNSAGEFNFHRGAGITVQKSNFEATLFVSYRKLSANFVADTINNEEYVTSILTSGYHRTVSEINDRNLLGQTAFGGSLKFKKPGWHIGLNQMNYLFSIPVKKRDEPYNAFALRGKNWNNFSLDYSYTLRNMHFFGEAAIDKNFNTAYVNGLLISADSRMDISILHRSISKKFQSVNGNAFTENTYPVNESGLFAGFSLRPADSWRIDAYADIFSFPWLKYLVDAPSRGKDFLVQLTYTPDKQTEVYTRFRNETKQSNARGNTTVLNYLVSIPRQNWRTQFQFRVNQQITLRNRVELLWYSNKDFESEKGFLTFFDVIYKPMLKPVSLNLRLQYFETEGYNSRIYAYENDVLYYFSIPAFFDKGYRYYLNLTVDVSKKISFWCKISQSVFPEKNKIGSGLDEIPGNRRTEVRIQTKIQF